MKSEMQAPGHLVPASLSGAPQAPVPTAQSTCTGRLPGLSPSLHIPASRGLGVPCVCWAGSTPHPPVLPLHLSGAPVHPTDPGLDVTLSWSHPAGLQATSRHLMGPCPFSPVPPAQRRGPESWFAGIRAPSPSRPR